MTVTRIRKKIIRIILGYPKTVSIQPIAYCTLDCEFCILKELNFGKKSDKTIMYSTEFAKITRDIYWWVDRIVFSGGEPLLNKDLGLMLSYARSYKVKTIVVTNAQFIKDRLSDLIASPPDQLIIAYEPPSEKYKDQSEHIKYLKENRYGLPEIILRMVLTKKNVDRVDEFKRTAKEIADHGELKSFGIWPEGNEEYLKLMEEEYYIDHEIARYKLKDGKIVFPRKPGKCTAINIDRHLSIKVDGSVLPCWYLTKPEPVGNAIKDNVSKFWFSKKYRARRKLMKYGQAEVECERCLYRSVAEKV